MKNITITTILSILMAIFIMVLFKNEILTSFLDLLKKIPKFVRIILYIVIIIALIYIIRWRA